MPINAILDVNEEIPLYGYTEPVTLDEAKLYCKIDFNEEDDLITQLITVSRETLEKYTGLSFVPKNLTVVLRNECGGIELPYGPTPYDIDVSTITDINGEVWDPSWIQIIGGQFKYLQTPVSNYVKLLYPAGYVSQTESLTAGGIPIPSALLMAIKAQVFFGFQNRGEQLSFGQGGVRVYEALYLCDAAKQFCNKYKRNTELSL